jgi:hypothetical protein
MPIPREAVNASIPGPTSGLSTGGVKKEGYYPRYHDELVDNQLGVYICTCNVHELQGHKQKIVQLQFQSPKIQDQGILEKHTHAGNDGANQRGSDLDGAGGIVGGRG